MVVEKAAGVKAVDSKVIDVKSVDVEAAEVQPENASSPTSQPALLPRWPTDPHSLDLEAKSEKLLDAFDIAVIATTIALLVKVVLVIVAYIRDRDDQGYDLDQVSDITRILIDFNSQMTTLFTIIFALIVGMLFKRIALFRAQEGTATVAELEQYQASGSLPGTLKAIWSLRSFRAFSLYLVFCWSWYYLGSQATTREYVLSISDAHSTFPIAFPSPNGTSAFATPDSLNDAQLSYINGQFVTSTSYISSALSSSGADQSGAMLVPYWGTTPNDDGTEVSGSEDGRHGWWDTSKASTITYASAIGLQFYSQPPEGIEGIGNLVGNVRFNTTFFNTSCGAPSTHTAAEFPQRAVRETALSFNMTSTTLSNENDNAPPPAAFDLWIRQNTSSITLKSSCTINTLYLEMQVHCGGPTCKANKVRLRTESNLPTNRSPFDDREFGDAFFSNLLISNGIPTHNASAGYSADGLLMATITNWYRNIDDSGDLVPPSPSDPLYQDDILSDMGDLSMAMTLLINSYYQASLLAQLSVNQIINSLESVDMVVSGAPPPTDWTVVAFDGAHYNPHYQLSIPWVTVDAISCLFLLIFAVQSMRIRKKTIAPDIFGYVSSLTRDNPDLALPDGGSTLSGFDRARLMKHVKIRIADVSGDPEIGRVGLKHAGSTTTEETHRFQPVSLEEVHLKRDRQYL